MKLVMFLGVVFWSVIAFFGTSKALDNPDNPLRKSLEKMRSVVPGGLLLPATLGFLLAIVFISLELKAIAACSGIIGGNWGLGIIFALIGSISLAGHISLKDE